MTGHIASLLVTGDNTLCSLSRKIMAGLLGGLMGLSSQIILEMDTVVTSYGAANSGLISENQ
jgi:hypothetical protein